MANNILLGYDNAEGAKIPLFVGKEQGVFEKYGIVLAVERVSPVKLGTPRLLSGQLQFLMGNSGPVIEEIVVRQKRLAVIASLGPARFAIFADQAIRRPEELKGRRFGVSTPGASQDRIARRALKKIGLEPKSDVEIVYTRFNNSTDRLKALARGEIDATLAGLECDQELPGLEPKAARQLRRLIDLSELGIHISGSDIALTRDYLEAHRDTVQRFLQALEKSIEVARESPDLVREAYEKYLQTGNSLLLESKVKEYYKLAPSGRPFPDRLAIKNNLEELAEKYPDLSLPDVESCIDESPLLDLPER
jgi:ABC-type nitrate/sulfonate/bicarbonate transport system substrate-binding protein